MDIWSTMAMVGLFRPNLVDRSGEGELGDCGCNIDHKAALYFLLHPSTDTYSLSVTTHCRLFPSQIKYMCRSKTAPNLGNLVSLGVSVLHMGRL